MKRTKRNLAVSWLLAVSLVLSLCAGILTSDKTRAESYRGITADSFAAVAPALKVSPDLLEQVDSEEDGPVKLIVQYQGAWSYTLNSILENLGGRVTLSYVNFNMRAVEMSASSILALAANPKVLYVSLDRPIGLFGHVTGTTGADNARSQGNTQGGQVDGSGIGIAVLDSGIDTNHKAFVDRDKKPRVVVSEDFTGEGRTDDPYGHGTHVASIAAGNGMVSNGAYLGIASNASLINLRVLNSRGTGSTSALLSALDWVMSMRATYNIRVVNMSLGATAVDSYKNDPACKAVRRLVNAGVVVFAASGNNGKNSNGQKVYGNVHVPGIEPSAITVGASNTFATNGRSDDDVTSFSSRGPTRGYWKDRKGAKHYDNLVKPDIVAPGNKIVAAEAVNNLIVSQHPELDANVSYDSTRKMMYLSGTSMATPVAAGAAALMLQVNPKLTPNMIKMILMYTAQQLRGYNMFEQGAGQINIDGAVRLSKLVRTDLTSSTALGSPLLMGVPPATQTTISGYTFSWGQGIIVNYGYVMGNTLITKYQKIYGLGVLLSDGVVVSDGVIASDRTMISDGVIVGDNIMISAGVIVGDGSVFCSSGVLLSDGVVVSDGQFFGDGVVTSDGVVVSDTGVYGDPTAGMPPEVDDGQP